MLLLLLLVFDSVLLERIELALLLSSAVIINTIDVVVVALLVFDSVLLEHMN